MQKLKVKTRNGHRTYFPDIGFHIPGEATEIECEDWQADAIRAYGGDIAIGDECEPKEPAKKKAAPAAVEPPPRVDNDPKPEERTKGRFSRKSRD